MNRIVEIVFVAVLASAVVCAVTPSLVVLLAAAVPFVLVVGLVVVAIRLVWSYTSRW